MTINTAKNDSKNVIIDKTTEEVVQDSIMGTDRAMGEDNPSTPAAWVFGTYPIVLLIVAFVAMLAYMLRGPESDKGLNRSGGTSSSAVSGVR